MNAKAFDGRERVAEKAMQKRYHILCVVGVVCISGCRKAHLPMPGLPCGDPVQAISAAQGYLKSRPKVESYLSLDLPPHATEFESEWIISFSRKERNVRPADLLFSVSKMDCSVDGPHGR